jgi:hypothetical protein
MTKAKAIQGGKSKVSKDIKEDLKQQIEAAKKAQAEKLEASREHYLQQMQVASEKYLTVNGYMQVRETFASVDENYKNDVQIITLTAAKMSKMILGIKEKAENTDVWEWGNILEGYLDSDFINKRPIDPKDITEQLLICSILQNLSPGFDEAAQFYEATQAEITKLEEELAK